MKAFLLAVLGALAVAALSGVILSMVQKESYVAFSTESTRVGEPGHNLLVDERAREGGRTHARE